MKPYGGRVWLKRADAPTPIQRHAGVQGLSDYARAVADEARNLPDEALRITLATRAGLTVAAIVNGLASCGRRGLEIQAVILEPAADVDRVMARWAISEWRDVATLHVRRPGIHPLDPAPITTAWDVPLHPFVDAKALPFVRPADVFWLQGWNAANDDQLALT